MVEYVCDTDGTTSLAVSDDGTVVEFELKEVTAQQKPVVWLDRDAVAALVGQLESWLERQRKGE